MTNATNLIYKILYCYNFFKKKKKNIFFFNTNSLKQLTVTLRLETRKKNTACIKHSILYLSYKL